MQSRGPSNGYATRREERRRMARARVAIAIVKPLSAAQKNLDPLSHPASSGHRSVLAAGWVVAALAVHVVAVMTGIWAGGEKQSFKRDEQEVKIEVREAPPPPPPIVETEPETEPEPAPEEPTPPKVEKAPLPKAEPKQAEPPPTDKPPPRVVGLSLDSTVEGGQGPGFAVGNTREGQTAKQAADPTKVAPVGVGPIVEQPTESPNRAASRIPTVGLVFTPAKKKKERKPPYPETLKSQGIEGDVVLTVTLDAQGKITAVKILKAALQPEFNESARKTALEDEYEPALKNGVPVPQTLTFTTRFRLEES